MMKNWLEKSGSFPNDAVLPDTMSLQQLLLLVDRNVPLHKLRSMERPYLDNLKRQIQLNGLKNPIQILLRDGRPYKILDGMHRLAVLEELNIDNIPVKYVADGN